MHLQHFKLAQHVTYLKQTKVGAAVGTPGRLGKLLNDTGELHASVLQNGIDVRCPDALKVSALSHIILDLSHKDAKTRNLLEIPETRDETFVSLPLGNAIAINDGRENALETHRRHPRSLL